GLYRYLFDGTVLFMNEGAFRILKLGAHFGSPAEVVGREISELLRYHGQRGLLRSKVRQQGHVSNLEYPFLTLDGELRWALHDSYLVHDRQLGVEAIQVIIQDITERKLAEQELAAQRERLAVTLRSIGDGVITTDVRGRVELMNTVAEELTGWRSEEAYGRGLAEVFCIFNEQTRALCENPVEKVLQSGKIIGLANNTLLLRRDGRELIIADSAAPILSGGETVGVVLVFRDVTDKRRAEEDQLKAEKLESLGLLAGGIAHDFNNILTSIMGSLSLARLVCVDEPAVLELLDSAEKASLRARDLTGQLLTFARGGAPVKTVTSLLQLVRDTAEFALRGSRSCYAVEYDDRLWPVKVDEGQISQVINNLVINADQAMPEGGFVRIQLRNIDEERSIILALPPGNYLEIVVTDSGIGIMAEHLGKIFDPYFSTKQKGSGLGLTTAYSIVKRHEGAIRVQSELGFGTSFFLYLPAIPDALPSEKPESKQIQIGTGRILVMDDDLLLGRVVTDMLGRLGYEPYLVPDGETAIRAYIAAMERGEKYSAVLFDLTVPGGMGGRETMAVLRAIDPDVRGIVSSGYANDPVLADFASHGFAAMVAKPYVVAQLSEVLGQVVRRPGSEDEPGRQEQGVEVAP
ncbi:MAG: PAS domain S-box protein, partial [Deltaproteobacteria bacterium]|nr:PAS domain S-box protein [Deltaproteobacteria bacterium]